jgi:hypothetical protein
LAPGLNTDMQHRCKFCPESYPFFAFLRGHIRQDHPDEWVKVKTWLGHTVDIKLEQFERKAAEGLRGPGKTEVAPCQTMTKP